MNSTQAKKSMQNFGKKGWAIIFYVLLIYLFSCVINDTVNVTMGVFAGLFGVSSNALLPFCAIGGFVGVLVSLIAGVIIARHNVKVPTAVLFFLFAVIWALTGQARSVPVFVVMTVLGTAVANTINLVCTQQIMSNWFPKKKGMALGWATMGMPISSALMVGVFQGLFGVSISAPYWLMAVICVVMGLVTLIWFKNYPEEANAYPDNEPISEAQKQKNLAFLSSYKSPWTIGRLFRTKAFWALVFLFGFLFIGLVGVISQMIPRLESLGMNTNQAIVWLTIASLIGIPGSFFWGWLEQKIGTGKTTRIFCVIWTLSMILACAGMHAEHIALTLVSVVLWACLNGGLGNLMPSMIIQVFGRYDFAQANQIAMPLVICLRSFALIIVPAILSAAGANVALGFRNVFLVFTVLSLVSTILSFLLKDKVIGTERAD